MGLQHKAKHFPSELSGGEQQRVGLARALVNNPAMIVADEPTGNIDPALSFEIVDLLNEINRRGTTVLMVTHEHSLVKHFHKRIIQIHSGEVVADTAELQQSVQPQTPETEQEAQSASMPETEEFAEDFSEDGEYVLPYEETMQVQDEFDSAEDYGFEDDAEEYDYMSPNETPLNHADVHSQPDFQYDQEEVSEE